MELKAHIKYFHQCDILYFSTLTEVPITKSYRDGNEFGSAIAFSAGPALSLPSMILINRIMGLKQEAYIILVILFSALPVQSMNSSFKGVNTMSSSLRRWLQKMQPSLSNLKSYREKQPCAEIEYIDDLEKLLEAKVLMPPAVFIDGVKSEGKNSPLKLSLRNGSVNGVREIVMQFKAKREENPWYPRWF